MENINKTFPFKKLPLSSDCAWREKHLNTFMYSFTLGIRVLNTVICSFEIGIFSVKAASFPTSLQLLWIYSCNWESFKIIFGLKILYLAKITSFSIYNMHNLQKKDVAKSRWKVFLHLASRVCPYIVLREGRKPCWSDPWGRGEWLRMQRWPEYSALKLGKISI